MSNSSSNTFELCDEPPGQFIRMETIPFTERNSTSDPAQTRRQYHRGSIQSRPEQQHEDAREAHAEVLHEEHVLARLDEGGEVTPPPPPVCFVWSHE
jgi:hypothetical protein